MAHKRDYESMNNKKLASLSPSSHAESLPQIAPGGRDHIITALKLKNFSQASSHSRAPMLQAPHRDAAVHNKTVRILTLPAELRNNIYDYILPQGATLRLEDGPGATGYLELVGMSEKFGEEERESYRDHYQEPPVLQVCKKMREEAVGIFYGNNKFECEVEDYDVNFVLDRTDSFALPVLQHCRHIVFTVVLLCKHDCPELADEEFEADDFEAKLVLTFICGELHTKITVDEFNYDPEFSCDCGPSALKTEMEEQGYCKQLQASVTEALGDRVIVKKSPTFLYYGIPVRDKEEAVGL